MKQKKENATKVAETKKIRVSKKTEALMQAIGRLQDAYFDMCRAFESKAIFVDDFTRTWNELCNKVDRKVGSLIAETFNETGYKEI